MNRIISEELFSHVLSKLCGSILISCPITCVARPRGCLGITERGHHFSLCFNTDKISKFSAEFYNYQSYSNFPNFVLSLVHFRLSWLFDCCAVLYRFQVFSTDLILNIRQ